LDKAIVEFKKAIELDPKHSRAHNNLGNALHDQGKVDEAVAAYQKALAIEPQDALGHNELAWLLATCPNAKFHDAKRAVELAMRAVELKPQEGTCWNTLGVAHYRAGNWKDAVAGLEKSMELRKGGDAYDWFFLAMADWQLGRKKQARKWYDQAVAWADKNEPKNEELRRFRAEAAELLAVPVEVGPAPREKK
jgi:superkiller protein 3